TGRVGGAVPRSLGGATRPFCACPRTPDGRAPRNRQVGQQASGGSMTRRHVSPEPRKRITLERHYEAEIADVWALWTTKEGIEAWWGPDGFFVTVRSIDVRPGGELRYAMTAKAPEMVAFMKANSMPVTTENLVTYVEVVENRRLRYLNWADFIPDVE